MTKITLLFRGRSLKKCYNCFDTWRSNDFHNHQFFHLVASAFNIHQCMPKTVLGRLPLEGKWCIYPIFLRAYSGNCINIEPENWPHGWDIGNDFLQSYSDRKKQADISFKFCWSGTYFSPKASEAISGMVFLLANAYAIFYV